MTIEIVTLGPKCKKQVFVGTLAECRRAAFADGYEITSAEKAASGRDAITCYYLEDKATKRTGLIITDPGGFCFCADL